LFGENEKSHTAQSRLVSILANDKHDPTLKEIEKAFDIETVTKEFFLKYRELFLRTKEELDRVVKKDPKIKADFEVKGVDTVNFAKKLLGQIIFLYFLQKKAGSVWAAMMTGTQAQSIFCGNCLRKNMVIITISSMIFWSRSFMTLYVMTGAMTMVTIAVLTAKYLS